MGLFSMDESTARRVYPQLMAAYDKAKAEGNDKNALAIKQELGLEEASDG